MTANLSRRRLLQALGFTGAGLVLAPSFLSRALAASPTEPARRALVTVFLRGGADGLSLVPPVEDDAYQRARPTLALKSQGDHAALKLQGVFGLHPALGALMPLWEQGRLAVLPGVGLPVAPRSHFDAQDFLESGTPGRKSTADGWLNRALEDANADAPLRAVALQPTLPRALYGNSGALAMGRLGDFRLRQGGDARQGFSALYAGAVDRALKGAGADAFEAMSRLDGARLAKLPVSPGVTYPGTPLARRLQDIARLLKGDVGLEVAATEMGGWDTHVAQGVAQGAFAKRCDELGGALAAFAADLGPRLDAVTVLVMTEFGRTVKENGNQGTDHGVGGAMLALGGGVKGGRVHGRFEALTADHLQDGRDVPSWTDVRAPLAEALRVCRPGVDLSKVFPGYTEGTPLGMFT
ncbi:DUF1501 domain-containing protein [Corallococcus terminator]|uniref:DUF1501 domain-containing protein n=1 Tax=Corallococcus terminator TaxID=2316733 RepID=A0A3A8J5P3_9BACT|nr:DUF1501 domain-containing protein [Corallococcus terminator]RKG85871.1 DUF1501 domain-containing protein [Corallococcus terminator]